MASKGCVRNDVCLAAGLHGAKQGRSLTSLHQDRRLRPVIGYTARETLERKMNASLGGLCPAVLLARAVCTLASNKNLSADYQKTLLVHLR